jgi:hypoxanthine phosphoribosyltransferase
MVSYENLPEVFYLGVYQPFNGGCDNFDFRGYSSGIRDIKDCDPLAIEGFADCISSNLDNDFDCLAIVPSHYNGTYTSGIKLLSEKISKGMNSVYTTSCLIRHKTIEKLSIGGNRSIQTHLNSIKVVDSELIDGKKVLLLDDVSTTGNSLKACKQLLESAGAKTVKSFILGKTTRLGEDLEFFCWQYDAIKERIEEEAECLKQQLHEDTKSEYEEINNYHQSEMKALSEGFHYGDLSEEEYNEQSYRLDEYCSNLSRDIDSGNYQSSQCIDYDAKCEMERLDNFYMFSSLDAIYC